YQALARRVRHSWLLAEDGAGAGFPVAEHAAAVLALHAVDRVLAGARERDAEGYEHEHELDAEAATEADEERGDQHLDAEEDAEAARRDARDESDAADELEP